MQSHAGKGADGDFPQRREPWVNREDEKLKTIRKYKFLSYISPLCLIWALAPSAQAKGTLSCTIVDESEKPAAKQEFTLTSSGGKQSKKKTNDQGEVKFTGLDDGTYNLSGEGAVPGSFVVSGNAEVPCKYAAVSVATANAKLTEVMQLIQQKKFGDAEEKAKKVLDLMPNLAESHYYLAVAYAYEGNDAAGTEVKKAAELSPDKFQKNVVPIQLQALLVQGKLAESKRDIDGAIKKYEAMLAVSPQEASAYYYMAVAYGNSGQFDPALKSIDKAIQLKPDDPEFRQMKDHIQDLYQKQLDKTLEKK